MEGIKLNGTLIGARKELNLIEGTGIDLTVGGQNDAASNEVDITIDCTVSASSGTYLSIAKWGVD